MKVLLTTVLIFSTSLVQASQMIDKLESGQHQKIVFMGTSLTWGGLYITPVQQWLESEFPGQTTIINSGVGGTHSVYGLANISTLALQYNPDVVFIEYSMNDAWRSSLTTPEGITLAMSEYNHREIIRLLKQQNPNVEIILMTMQAINRNINEYPYVDDVRPNLPLYYDIMRKLGKELNLLVIDHYPHWLRLLKINKPQYVIYVPDGCHAMQPGYEAIFMPTFKLRLRCPEIGDYNCDKKVDINDLQYFENCASGPGVIVSGPQCNEMDFDSDSDVDQSDFGLFQILYGNGIN